MSFVMISAGPTSSARVRTLPIRTLLGAGALLALGLLAFGGALGFWASQQVAAAAAQSPPAPSPSPSALPFAIEQLGALSGRLFRLESQAGQLSQRMGLLQGRAVQPAQPASDARGIQGPSGGPMLPARPEPEGLVALQSRLSELEQQLERVAAVATQQTLARMRLPTRLPLEGADLVSGFGNRDDPLDGRRAFHAGLDFAAAQGTAIHAAAGGTVAFAGVRPEFGRVVEIDHGNGLSTRYAHASALWVKTGDFVAPGEAIATVGSTGRSTGAHLHFEVLQHGEAVNPRQYLAGL